MKNDFVSGSVRPDVWVIRFQLPLCKLRYYSIIAARAMHYTGLPFECIPLPSILLSEFLIHENIYMAIYRKETNIGAVAIADIEFQAGLSVSYYCLVIKRGYHVQ